MRSAKARLSSCLSWGWVAVPVIWGLLVLVHDGGGISAFDGVCCHALDPVCALSVAALQIRISSPTSYGLPQRSASEGIFASPLERPPRPWG